MSHPEQSGAFIDASAASLDYRDQAPEQQALHWLIALQEDDGNRIRNAWQQWLDTSPEHTQAWVRSEHLWRLLGQQAPARPNPLMAAPRPGRPRRRRLAWLGSAVAACLVIALLPGWWLNLRADHITGAAQIREWTLSDGSRISLAANSAVAVDYGGGQRQVRLLKGEAFFEVKADPLRPFVVTADGLRATVLGTAFEVSQRDSQSSVSVLRGKVRVSAGTGDTTLIAGQRLQLDAGAKVTRSAVPGHMIAGWRDGHIALRNRPLHEAVDELRDYFPGLILLPDPLLGERHLSGVYDLQSPRDALAAMALATGAEVRQLTPWLLIVEAAHASEAP